MLFIEWWILGRRLSWSVGVRSERSRFVDCPQAVVASYASVQFLGAVNPPNRKMAVRIDDDYARGFERAYDNVELFMARGLWEVVFSGEWRSIERSDGRAGNLVSPYTYCLREYAVVRCSLHHGMKLLTIRLHSPVVPTVTASSDAATIPA